MRSAQVGLGFSAPASGCSPVVTSDLVELMAARCCVSAGCCAALQSDVLELVGKDRSAMRVELCCLVGRIHAGFLWPDCL